MSRYAHNSYLQIWPEMGLLGLFSFDWLICGVFRLWFRNFTESLYKNQAACLFTPLEAGRRRCPTAAYGSLPLTGFTASAVFLLHNFLDFTFFLPEVAFIWWVILGLITVQDHKYI